MFILRWNNELKRWEVTCEVCGEEDKGSEFSIGISNIAFLDRLYLHYQVCSGGAAVKEATTPTENPSMAEMEASMERVMTKVMRVTNRLEGRTGNPPRSPEEERELLRLERDGEPGLGSGGG